MGKIDPDIQLLRSSVELPNGRIVPNRLVKVAMEEGIGWGGGLPDQRHCQLYRTFASGGWGMIITGNAHVDPSQLATPHCRYIPDDSIETIQAYKRLRDVTLAGVPSEQEPPLLLIQLSHAGLQSSATYSFSRPPWEPAVAPCSERPDMGDSVLGCIMGRVLWPFKSRAIEDSAEWFKIVDLFIKCAIVAERAEWDGVQIHSAHGYLLASYISPLVRSEILSGRTLPLRLHLLYLILDGICRATQKSFIKALKINSSDFVLGGLNEAESADLIREIVSWSMVDILEVSGGSYSNPTFAEMEAPSPSLNRQSLFANFTKSLLPQLPQPPKGPAILLTGGLHSRPLIADSLRNACHLAGIGRPACLQPALPLEVLLNPEIEREDAYVGGYTISGGETMKWVLGGGSSKKPSQRDKSASGLAKNGNGKTGIPLVGAGVSTMWHEWQLHRIARGAKPDAAMDWLWGGLVKEGIWWGLLGGGPLEWCRRTRQELEDQKLD
ncbi:hypothetical protein M231_06544 [Tremella mesenterica]|uniref:NADH:flavin oxidoreductase/NADH oxidase N-terminal domain-containing protein n=1 Tax=Tremella mesenterica TaxID=5217 RepID=A0A4V1M3A6_TREME|nr:hypothetical protein M231_06544 [Tremella mesenterica]